MICPVSKISLPQKSVATKRLLSTTVFLNSPTETNISGTIPKTQTNITESARRRKAIQGCVLLVSSQTWALNHLQSIYSGLLSKIINDKRVERVQTCPGFCTVWSVWRLIITEGHQRPGVFPWGLEISNRSVVIRHCHCCPLGPKSGTWGGDGLRPKQCCFFITQFLWLHIC